MHTCFLFLLSVSFLHFFLFSRVLPPALSHSVSPELLTPAPMLNAILFYCLGSLAHVLKHLILPTTLRGEYCADTHFIDEETGVQSDPDTHLKRHVLKLLSQKWNPLIVALPLSKTHFAPPTLPYSPTAQCSWLQCSYQAG